jgi:histidinol dehydrogenase
MQAFMSVVMGCDMSKQAEDLLTILGTRVQGIIDEVQDEGDRVYLNSTNDLDRLHNVLAEIEEWQLTTPEGEAALERQTNAH